MRRDSPRDELTWPSTWTDRLGRDRTPSIPGQELAGVVTALGYGTTGLSVGQRVFGLTDSYRGGTLAEYVAVEARNLAPLPGDVDFTVGASLAMPGLTAWQGLFEHGRLQAGQSVLVHGAAGAVGSMVTQLAREAGAYVIGTGRAADRQKALDFGAQEFVDLENDALEDVGGVDLVFDVIGGDIQKRSAGLIRAGGTLVTIAGPPEARPADGLAVDFVVVSDRAQLGEIVRRVRDGRLRTNIGNIATLDDAVAAFNPTERISREDDHPRSSVSDTRPSMHAASWAVQMSRNAVGWGNGFHATSTKRQMTEETIPMKAIVVTDQAAGTAGMKLVERPEPQAAINDVVVQVHASGFVPTEMAWPSTWTDRLGRDRTPSIPGHELAGVVTALGYGTTGLSVGQRVFGLADWHRDGTLAEYVAVEARNLAPLPGDVDFTVGASLPISGLTAWQGLFEHGRLQAGQSVLAHGAAGAVGTMVTQLAREAGAYVIGTGRAADRQKALDFGAQEFVDLDNDALEDVGGVDLVFDVIGGDIQKRSARLIRAGGTLVSIVGPAEARPADGLAVDFVVESDRAQLSEIVRRVRDGRLRTNIGNVSTLDDAVAAFNATERRAGKTIIRVRP